MQFSQDFQGRLRNPATQRLGGGLCRTSNGHHQRGHCTNQVSSRCFCRYSHYTPSMSRDEFFSSCLLTSETLPVNKHGRAQVVNTSLTIVFSRLSLVRGTLRPSN
jgi:hypothetical protein